LSRDDLSCEIVYLAIAKSFEERQNMTRMSEVFVLIESYPEEEDYPDKFPQIQFDSAKHRWEVVEVDASYDQFRATKRVPAKNLDDAIKISGGEKYSKEIHDMFENEESMFDPETQGFNIYPEMKSAPGPRYFVPVEIDYKAK
jgi:hypothetical protein